MAARPENNQVESAAGAPASAVSNRERFRDGGEAGSAVQRTGDDGGRNVCFVCKKSFRSAKALFGHMRSHPERSWRGIKPPQSPAGGGISPTAAAYNLGARKDRIGDCNEDGPPAAADGLGFFQPVEPLPGWSRTAKRGGTGIAACAALSSPAKLQSTPDGSFLSLLVTVANYSVSSSTSSKKKRKVSDFRAQMGNSSMGITEGGMNKDQVFPNGEFRTGVMFPIGKKQYECRDCGKSFSNPQALGGHRANHSRGATSKSITTTTAATSTVSTAKAPSPDNSAAIDEVLLNTEPEEPGSGTGEGGSRVPKRALPGCEPLSICSGRLRKSSGKVFAFDLNELPALEEDEEEGEMWN